MVHPYVHCRILGAPLHIQIRIPAGVLELMFCVQIHPAVCLYGSIGFQLRQHAVVVFFNLHEFGPWYYRTVVIGEQSQYVERFVISNVNILRDNDSAA